MVQITKYRYEDFRPFLGIVSKISLDYARSRAPRLLISTTAWSSVTNGFVLVQYDEHVTYFNDDGAKTHQDKRVNESHYNNHFESLDFSRFDIGPKILNLPNGPMWHEIRPWLMDNLLETVCVIFHGRGKRLSFSSDEDYMLTRLAWG